MEAPTYTGLINARAVRAWAEGRMIWLELVEGRLLGFPADQYPLLRAATDAQLAEVAFSYEQTALRWEALDEDILIQHVLEGRFP